MNYAKYIPPAVDGEVITPEMATCFKEALAKIATVVTSDFTGPRYICYALDDLRSGPLGEAAAQARSVISKRLKASTLEEWMERNFPAASRVFNDVPKAEAWQAIRKAWLESMSTPTQVSLSTPTQVSLSTPTQASTKHVHSELMVMWANDSSLIAQRYLNGVWQTDEHPNWLPSAQYRVVKPNDLQPGDTFTHLGKAYIVCTSEWFRDTFGIDATGWDLLGYRTSIDSNRGVAYWAITDPYQFTKIIRGTDAARKAFGG